MLYADKNALRTQLKVQMLRIRERELLFYTNNCLSISTSAALLAGFAWYGLTEVPFDEGADVVTQTCYLVVTTLIMGLELLTVVNATLCAILGPGLALRGPDGSMHTAVNGMHTHYRFTLACFTGGLVCFMISALLYAWMQFDVTLAVPVTLLITYFLSSIYRYTIRIMRRFRSKDVVTGAFSEEKSTGGVGGSVAGGVGAAAQQPLSPEEQALAAQRERERAMMEQQFASLPESVRNSMQASYAGEGGGSSSGAGIGGY